MKNIILSLFVFSCCFCFSQTKKINVYTFIAEECPISIYMCKDLKTISAAYSDKANFYLVFPLQTSTAKTATKFKAKNKLAEFNIIVDNQQTLTKKLGASITPEVVITDSANTILYKGRINDAYLEPGKRRHIYNNNDLSNALLLLSNGKQVPTPWKPAIGCYITINKK